MSRIFRLFEAKLAIQVAKCAIKHSITHSLIHNSRNRRLHCRACLVVRRLSREGVKILARLAEREREVAVLFFRAGSLHLS